MGMRDDDIDDDLWLLLDRYAAGEATGDEVARVRAWLAVDHAHHELLGEVRAIRDIGARRPPSRVVDDAWRTAKQAMSDETRPRVGARHPRGAWQRYALAAGLV